MGKEGFYKAVFRVAGEVLRLCFASLRMTNGAGPRRRGRGGSVFILVLIVVASLVALSAGLGFRTRIEMRLAHAYGRKVQAHYLAMGGIERIKVLLSEKELSASVVGAVCHFNGTERAEGVFEQLRREGVLEKEELAYCLRDELGYFNINRSDPSVWEKLEGVSAELCGEIVDWTDADGETSAGGAESDYYMRLEPGYVCKNGAGVLLKELLYLRSVGAKEYAGEDGDHDGVLVLSDTIRDLTVKRSHANEIDARARAEGMTSLLQTGLQKIEQQIATYSEILRATKGTLTAD